MTDDPRAQTLVRARKFLSEWRYEPPEQWHTIMQELVDLLAVVPPPPQELKKEQEDTRVDEGQPQACRPTGSTAASNEVIPS